MKKVLLTILLLFIPFFIYAEECDTDKVTVKSIELIDKTTSVEEYDPPAIEEGIIYLDIGMSYLNDSAEYRVVLDNASNQDFNVNKNLTNDSKYIEYRLEPVDGTYVINKNSSEEFILTIKYINKVEAADFYDGYYEEEKELLININDYVEESTNNETKDDGIVNPKTGFDTTFIVLALVVGITVLIVMYNLKKRNIFFVLILLVLLIPPIVKAICTKDIKISSYVTINQTYEGMLMERNTQIDNYLTTNIGKRDIKKIKFTNSLNGHTSNDAGYFDVSVNQDGTVLAWVSDTDNSGLVTLTIAAEGKVYASNGSSLFWDLYSLETMEGMQYFDTTYVTDMSYMFACDIHLKSLDLSHFDTSNVTTMNSMFSMRWGSTFLDSSLISLDLSSFDTSKVKDMYEMFYNCTAMTSLNVSSFDTSRVTNMFYMFAQCSSLTTLNLSSFNTINVANMEGMFLGCSSLASLNISSFNTSNATTMREMFYNCYNLAAIDVSHFDTSKVTNMSFMFDGCSALTSLNLSSFDTSNVTDMGYMFRNCTNLREITVSQKFKTDNVIGNNNSGYMFFGCTSLRGGSGTVYDPNHTNKDYAHIDYGTSNPGYFTSAGPY